MTLKEALLQTRHCLSASEEASLEAEVLLRHALQMDRTRFYLHRNHSLTEEESATLHLLLERRQRGEPLAYILGHREFYGLDFLVDRRVPIPRPETELLVEKAIAYVKNYRPSGPCIAADVGTGCGAIAVALAVHLPHITLYATDLSSEALGVAAESAARHEVGHRITFLQGDLLEPLPEPVDVLLANLPYVKFRDWQELPPEIRLHEPRLALDGGEDGLKVIERFLAQAPCRLWPGGNVLLEIAWDQGAEAFRLARRYFPEARIEILRDLGGHDRLLTLETGAA